MKSIDKTIEFKFKKLEILLKENFHLTKEKLGGEIPFFILPYLPQDNNFVEKETNNLIKKLANNGIEIVLIDLFELSIEILKQKNLLQAIVNKESSIKKEIFLKQIRTPIDVNSVITPEIEKRIQNSNFKALIIKGVGSVFPIIRSHNLLNNLQTMIKDKPMIMLFPGIYDGKKLELFGMMKDDNYYRAYNLDFFEI
jgi:hypothetical protein